MQLSVAGCEVAEERLLWPAFGDAVMREMETAKAGHIQTGKRVSH